MGKSRGGGSHRPENAGEANQAEEGTTAMTIYIHWRVSLRGQGLVVLLRRPRNSYHLNLWTNGHYRSR